MDDSRGDVSLNNDPSFLRILPREDTHLSSFVFTVGVKMKYVKSVDIVKLLR